MLVGKIKLIAAVILLGIVFSCLPAGMAFIAYADTSRDKVVTAIEEYILTERPDWQGEDIRISFKGGEKVLRAYGKKQEVEFKVPSVYKLTKITPQMVLPMAVMVNGAPKEKFNVRVKVELYKDVVVALKKINKSAVVTAKDIGVAKREVALLPAKYFEDTQELVGKMAKASIYEGSVVFDWMIKLQPSVVKGQKVKIIAESPGLLVEAAGIALEDGQIGDTIKVKRVDSKEKIEAEITDSNEVEVKL